MAVAEEQPEKHCWVCFATERDDLSAEWVSPCRCKGCTKWIHQACLQRWLDEKQKGNSGGAVDRALSRASPFAAVGVVVGTVYWSAVTYGAVTVMQVRARRYVPRVPADGFGAGDHLSVSRTLCGALVFPSIASLVGRLLFRRMSSSLQRTVLGGIAFVLIKGVLKVYFKQQQVIMQTSRIILNYPERSRDGQSEGGEEDTEDTEDSGNE
ncbi:hypothetical protein FQN60_005231 [Etheostoma spectabile]|uniref:E3 ubiquitin-protein ligase MARCHF5 n=1 Tax=Etheostoma spectabile TaxID=54343 RepID=A0A5J5DLX2_9PERO|nr:hypothetical protein FQN60_005231 [Etheostoma spectabile]